MPAGSLCRARTSQAMDDDTGFAGAGAGEDEVVVVAFVGDDGVLDGVECAGDFFQGGGGDVFFEFGFPPFEPFVVEVAFFVVEVVFDEFEAEGDFFECFDRVFAHGVDLQAFADVVARQLGKVVFEVILVQVGFVEVDGHRVAQDGHAVVQADDLVE